jgi:MraZ protein
MLNDVTKGQTVDMERDSVGQPIAGAAFMSSVTHSLDPRRRLTIPAGWRDVMGGPRYVYVMPDPVLRCLNLLPVNVLSEMLPKPKDVGLFNSGVDAAFAALSKHAEHLPLDVQGRIRIRDGLLDWAGLHDKVVLVGMNFKIQLWAPENYPSSEGVDQAELAAALKALGI